MSISVSTQYRREKAKKQKEALIEALRREGYTVEEQEPLYRIDMSTSKLLRALERQIAREEREK